MAANRIDIEITGKENAKGAFDKVGSYMRNLQLEARKSGESALSTALSGPGGLATAGLQAAGLGIAGIFAEKIGEALDQATEKMVKLEEETNRGKTNAADMALGFGESIPILGSFMKAGENINEIMFHTKENVAELNEQARLTTEFFNFMTAAAAKAKDESIKHANVLRDIADQTKLIGLTGLALTKETIAQQAQKAKDARDQELDALRRRGPDAEHQKTRNDLEKSITDHDAELQLLQGSGVDPNADNRDARRLHDLLEARDQAHAAIAKIDADFRKEVATKTKENAATDAAADADAKKTLIEAEKAHKRELETVEREHRQRMADIRLQAQQAALQAEGQDFAAKQAGIVAAQKKADDEAAAKAGEELRLANSDPERTAIGNRYGESTKANEALAAAQMKALQVEHDEELAKLHGDAIEAQKDAEATAAEDHLRRLGQGHQADIMAIRRQGEKRIEEINRQAKAEAATHAEFADDIMAKAKANAAQAATEMNEQIREENMKANQREFRLSSMEEVGHTTGVAAAAREQNDPARIAQQAAIKAEKQREELAAIMGGVQKGIQSLLKVLGVPDRIFGR